jgi:hypothetical protein
VDLIEKVAGWVVLAVVIVGGLLSTAWTDQQIRARWMGDDEAPADDTEQRRKR